MRYAYVTKKPNEKFAVGFKYSSADLAGGATISSVETTVEKVDPNDSGDILAVVGSPVADEYTVSAVIEKGNDGKEYYVAFKTTTSVGYIFEDRVFVKVREV
jgi:hypothetical protein